MTNDKRMTSRLGSKMMRRADSCWPFYKKKRNDGRDGCMIDPSFQVSFTLSLMGPELINQQEKRYHAGFHQNRQN